MWYPENNLTYYMFGKRSESSDEVITHWGENGIRSVNFQPGRSHVKQLRKEWQTFAEKIDPYPDCYEGTGIVICGGGVKYFTCAWVNIHLLRRNGCVLPIELWYSDEELTHEMIEVLQSLNVTCKDAAKLAVENVSGFVLKPIAILHSRFKEVLYLDADNTCTVDPTYLFYCDQYRSCGAVFWPDLWHTNRKNPIWKITGSDDYQSIEQESGQILINKEKCWRELNLCLYFNLNNHAYYKMLLGDKDTFKFAWKALRNEYYIIGTPVALCGYKQVRKNYFSRGVSLLQHDFEGNFIFIHRNLLKWDVTLDDEMVWGKIKRFASSTTNRTFKPGLYDQEGEVRYYGLDIDGDVETLDFFGAFGDFEVVCLDILKGLRQSDFYARFLIHSYLTSCKPGYRELRHRRVGSTINLIYDE